MARTKKQVRNWLNSQVGRSVNAKSGRYRGQCVSLTKALLEYLGAPDPYKARGNAKDVGDSYVREGIAKNGDGWLRVVVNRSMGRIGGKVYGHVWIDIKGGPSYEQNGARALHTTKNTRPYSHRQQVVNLDKYIKAPPKPKPAPKPSPAPKGNKYTVKRGDNLIDIAKRYGLTWKQLYKRGNNRSVIGPNPNYIKPGQVLSVPSKKPSGPTKQHYRVRKGDNLSSIAARRGATVAKLVNWNKGKYPTLKTNRNLIRPGWVLRVK